jgi:hypothetical protein
MKLHYRQALYILLALFLLAGCAGLPQQAPQTLPEKMASLEIAYGEFLDLVQVYLDEGRLTEPQLNAIEKLDESFYAAKKAAYFALDLGDLKSAEAKYAAALMILTELRERVK